MSTQQYIKPDPVNIPPIPRSIDDLPFWGVWKFNAEERKVAFNPRTGQAARSNDSATFGTRAEAERAFATGRYRGLCVLVDESLGITMLDIDEIIPEDRAFDEAAIPPRVRRVMRMTGSPFWWTQSGCGLRSFVAATTGQTFKNKNGGKNGIIAEQYTRLRFATVMLDRQIDGTPDTFNTDVDDLVAVIEALGFPEREQDQPAAPRPAYSGGSRSNALIVETASRVNGAKFRRLHEGETSDYPESQTDKGFSSEADGAYVLILCGYTGDDAQVADLWRSESRLYRKKLDRQDYVDRTIESARRKQSWWFDWESNGRFASRAPNDHDGYSIPPAAATAASANTTCDAQLKDALSTITRQAETIRQQRETLQGIERILANDQIQIGPRVTGIALLLELNSQKQRGKKPREHGHHIPAVWLARRTGSTAKTANSHVKKLEKMHLIQRKVVSEVITEDEVVDEDSGEIFGTIRKRAYYPADQASAIITNLAQYRRKDEDAKHGGKRILACNEHPDAGTIKRWTLECAECHKELDSGKDHRKPDGLQDNAAPPTQDGSSTARDDQAAPNITRIPKMGHQTTTVDIDRPKMGQREMTGIPEEPPDFWTGAPSEPEPWFWNEGAVS